MVFPLSIPCLPRHDTPRLGSGNRVTDGGDPHRRTGSSTYRLYQSITAVRYMATAENMAYLHQRGGRFLTVLPRTRAEDTAFRAAVREGKARWQPIHERRDDDG